MVIVETPNTVRAGWFKVICALDFPHQVDIPWDYEEDDGRECGRWKYGDAIEAEKPDDEVEFMA